MKHYIMCRTNSPMDPVQFAYLISRGINDAKKTPSVNTLTALISQPDSCLLTLPHDSTPHPSLTSWHINSPFLPFGQPSYPVVIGFSYPQFTGCVH